MQSHIKLVLLLGFYEALLRLVNQPVAKEVRCLDLQFHLEAFTWKLVSNTIVYFHTLKSVHLLLSHLSSLLPFLKTIKKKTAGTSHKKFSQRKTSACRDATLKNQPNKMRTTSHCHKTFGLGDSVSTYHLLL